MASLTSSFNVGSGSASSLIKSATSLANELATFQDDEQDIQYQNSAKTDADFQAYQSYLQGRVNTLQSTGTIADETKALTMSQKIISAQHSNISANIQRENIQVMAGNATLTDKYNTIVSQYSTALSIGDDALAQSLESQAYSVSQSIQYQAQTAATAASTLAKANATASAGSQRGAVASLQEGLKELNNDSKNVGQAGFNNIVTNWVKSNTGTLAALGVHLAPGQQPNYFNLVDAVNGAVYNHDMLAYQAELPLDPVTAQGYYNDAINLQQGITKVDTLGGSLTAQQITAAANNPSMFAYDSTTGTYKQTQQTGYSGYDQNGNPVASYSGDLKQTTFLTPTQTGQMNKLGLSFTQGNSNTAASKKNDTTNVGDGVQVQASSTSPQWLKNLIGENGVTNVYVDKTGNNGTTVGLQIEGDSTDGTGRAYYTVATDANGRSGAFEHLPDGSTQAVGGDYGFSAGAVQLLINQAEGTAHLVAVQQANAAVAAQQAAAKLKLTTPTVTAPAPVTSAPKTNIQGSSPKLQNTVNPQATANPQPASTNAGKTIQPTVNPQNGSGDKGIPLGSSSGPSIPL